MMRKDEKTIWCDGCGAEITWGPIVARNRIYCCEDCVHRISCDCGYRMEFDEETQGSSTKSRIITEYPA